MVSSAPGHRSRTGSRELLHHRDQFERIDRRLGPRRVRMREQLGRGFGLAGGKQQLQSRPQSAAALIVAGGDPHRLRIGFGELRKHLPNRPR